MVGHFLLGHYIVGHVLLGHSIVGHRVHTGLQAHGVELGLAGTVVVACTATLAAIGAAAIPSAGLVTMLMVLQVESQLLVNYKPPVNIFLEVWRSMHTILTKQTGILNDGILDSPYAIHLAYAHCHSWNPLVLHYWVGGVGGELIVAPILLRS